eukprot:COSAG05_NODE_1254_length_5375_cov_10.078658_3_plen_150_part_00
MYRSQHELIKNAMIITDTVFGLEYPRPLPPLVKMVGPLLPAKLPQLSSSVTDWIRSSDSKVVLIHLGSMTYLEPWQVKEMLDGFSGDSFRVLVRICDPSSMRMYTCYLIFYQDTYAVGDEQVPEASSALRAVFIFNRSQRSLPGHRLTS